MSLILSHADNISEKTERFEGLRESENNMGKGDEKRRSHRGVKYSLFVSAC